MPIGIRKAVKAGMRFKLALISLSLVLLLTLSVSGCGADESPEASSEAEASVVNDELLAISARVAKNLNQGPIEPHPSENLIWSHGTAAEVRAALRAGARPDGPASIHQSAPPSLITAIRYNSDLEAARALIEAGADPNLSDGQGATALHFAVLENDIGKVELLLAAGARAEAVNNAGENAIHLVLGSLGSKYTLDNLNYSDLKQILTALLDAGADPNARRNDGDTPLHLFARSAKVYKHSSAAGLLPALRVLIDRGADINRASQGFTPILRLAVPGNSFEARNNNLSVSMLKLMIELGGDVNAETPDGQSLLILCARHFQKYYAGSWGDEAVFLSLSLNRFQGVRKADVLLDRHWRLINIFSTLLDAGAEPDARDRKGKKAYDYLHQDARIILHAAEVGNRMGRQFSGFLGECAYGSGDSVRKELKKSRVNAGDSNFFNTPPLSIAAFHNPDAEVIDVLLKNGADPDQRNKFGLRPLHFAATAKNAAAVKLLLEAGAEINAPDRYGRRNEGISPSAGLLAIPLGALTLLIPPEEYREYSLLHYAAAGMSADQAAAFDQTLRVLIEAGADLGSPVENPLHFFARTAKISNDSDISTLLPSLRALVAAGADPNAVPSAKDQWLAKLMLDSGGELCKAKVSLMAALGFNINLADNEGRTPLIYLASFKYPGPPQRYNQERMIGDFTFLLNLGADPALLDRKDKRAYDYLSDKTKELLAGHPLQARLDVYGLFKGFRETFSHSPAADIRKALAGGVDPNGVNIDDQGKPPLVYALANPAPEALKALLEAGADPDVADAGKITPLMAAVKQNHIEAMEILLEGGADPELSDGSRTTPLMAAADRRSSAAMELLLRYGAKTDARNTTGMVPLHALLSNLHRMTEEDKPEYEKCLRLLLKAGADPNLAGRNGATPVASFIYYAKFQPKLDIGLIAPLLRELAAAGADINIMAPDYPHPPAQLELFREKKIPWPLVDLMIELGWNINGRSPRGLTPLMYGASARYGRIYVNEGGQEGLMSLDDFTRAGILEDMEDFFTQMLSRGADPYKLSREGKTAFEYLSPFAQKQFLTRPAGRDVSSIPADYSIN